jgi:hypothetical protein
MKGRSGPLTSVLRPVLDLYLDSAVALVGCQSTGINRASCELDVVVVTDEERPSTSVKMAGTLVDITFVTEKEALTPSNPEHTISLAQAVPVRDTTLILSTSSAANRAVMGEAWRKSSRARLSSALKVLGRADEALSREALGEADFWAVASAYEYAYAWLYSKEVAPSPSHLLAQLRSQSKGAPKAFEAFSGGAGLEGASRAVCATRMEGVEVLQDLLHGGESRIPEGSTWSTARLDIVRAKANELGSSIELAECYSYLGQEVVDYMLALSKVKAPKARRPASGASGVPVLLSGKNRLLGERLAKELGLARSKASVERSLAALREQVSSSARRL